MHKKQSFNQIKNMPEFTLKKDFSFNVLLFFRFTKSRIHQGEKQ